MLGPIPRCRTFGYHGVFLAGMLTVISARFQQVAVEHWLLLSTKRGRRWG